MFNKIIHFIKYNNATILIIAAVLIVGTSAFASETGRAAIGGKQIRVEGVDNTLLLAADLDTMDMDFKIEKIEEDDKYYYITYTYLDLVKINNAWQYQLQEKTRKVSRKLKQDLGVYLAEELGEEYQARIKELKKEQKKAREQGEEKRLEVVEYSGLIGKVLDTAGKVFSNYEPVKKRVIPSPKMVYKGDRGENKGDRENRGDDLVEIYNNYIKENDPDKDNVFAESDNCPVIYNPDQLDSDGDGIGDECDLTPKGEVSMMEGGAAIATGTTAVIATTTIATTTPGAETDISAEEVIGQDKTEQIVNNTDNVSDVEEEVEIIELPSMLSTPETPEDVVEESTEDALSAQPDLGEQDESVEPEEPAETAETLGETTEQTENSVEAEVTEE